MLIPSPICVLLKGYRNCDSWTVNLAVECWLLTTVRTYARITYFLPTVHGHVPLTEYSMHWLYGVWLTENDLGPLGNYSAQLVLPWRGLGIYRGMAIPHSFP
ncbi:hypothetical protein F3Y22_tig00110160pilonHSYRG00765 [Hibiscus syriacus]|uniref:Uncharacterized protein n=1 Tax=Hibiscus syriacus TaxID=106335 RepID=A0A6A3BI10_HIBSY|nr:hypothetical protein F3Y22_tig00110160pilonHSYRG00765 [Hibiscus syriacus]